LATRATEEVNREQQALAIAQGMKSIAPLLQANKQGQGA